MRTLFFIPLFVIFSSSTAVAQGSGSNASLSLLQLEDPLEACLLAGAELYHLEDIGEDPAVVLGEDTQSLVWSITFDQSIVEVEHEKDYLFVLTEQIEFGTCT